MEEKTVKIVSVNISEEKGTVKKPAGHIELDKTGIAGDAHSGDWHRQVSLLGLESVRKYSKQAGREIGFGEFAENITTEGMELWKVHPLDRFRSDRVELEVTQIGKKCHGRNCAIYTETGDCVMPKEGIFARVVNGGRLSPGDIFSYHPRVFRILIVTLSDRAYRGVYADKSGPEVAKLAGEFFQSYGRITDIRNMIIPDDEFSLKTLLLKSRRERYDFIITTGGTGIGKRDVTPDVVKPLLDKEIPGIMEMIRVRYGNEKPNALLSRGVAGLLGQSFIYTLPGSVSAVREYMHEITKTMEHLLLMLNGIDTH